MLCAANTSDSVQTVQRADANQKWAKQTSSEKARHYFGVDQETEQEITNTKATKEQEEVDYAIFTVELTEEVESSIITAEQSS